MKSRYKQLFNSTKVEEACWQVYILRCEDGTLYTGMAKDAHARLKKHKSGKGATYTRLHVPVELVYLESNFTRSAALKREYEIKRLPKVKKLKLLSSFDGSTSSSNVSATPPTSSKAL